ncbi:MAG: T9SS type A sorting domain-containing protein [Bacteroidetes bacterium]|nr:T9SS type A sorting domain-containing protein [Bacteroidota bacterium]
MKKETKYKYSALSKIIIDIKAVRASFILPVVCLMNFLLISTNILANTPPVLNNIEPSALAYTEGDPATIITQTLTITDVDDIYMEGARVAFENDGIDYGFHPGKDTLIFSDTLGISGSFDNVNGILTLSGTAPISAYETALRSIKYFNSDPVNPHHSGDVIEFQVTDGDVYSEKRYRYIDMITFLNPPASLPYCEDFETDGAGTRYALDKLLFFDDEACAFFDRTTQPSECSLGPVKGVEGNYYLAYQGTRNTYENYVTLNLAPIDASGMTYFEVELLAAIPEGSDLNFLALYTHANPGGRINLGGFSNYNGRFIQVFRENSGPYFAAKELTDSLQSYTFAFNANTSKLGFVFWYGNEGNMNEEIMIDNICITGWPTGVVLIPQRPSLCAGTNLGIDLTQYEGDITSESGTFTYAKIDPDGILPPTPVSNPTQVDVFDGDAFEVSFTPPGERTQYTSITFTVGDPVLNQQQISLCVNASQYVNLTDYQENITPLWGNFLYFTDSDPVNPISDPENVLVSDGSTFTVLYTRDEDACTSTTTISFDLNPVVALAALQPSLTFLEAEHVDLTQYESTLTSETGSYNYFIPDRIIPTELFFSEYVEKVRSYSGTTSRYVEIYNGTGQAVDLSNYEFRRYLNAASTPDIIEPLSGMLADGDVLVLASPASNTYTGSVLITPAAEFDGDDALVLYNKQKGTYADIFGNIGGRFGYAWLMPLPQLYPWYTEYVRTSGTHLIRKPKVLSGVMIDPAGYEFPTLAEEWEMMPYYGHDVNTTLGSHSIAPGNWLIPDPTDISVKDGDEILVTFTSGDNCISTTSIVFHVLPASDFTLIDALTDLDIGPLLDGDILDLATLPTNQLAIRANLEGPDVASVRFGFQNVANFRIENFAPYALHGDDNGDYDPYTYTPGTYTVSATPYDKRNGKGTKGQKRTVNFTVIDSNPGAKIAEMGSGLKIYPNPVQTKFTLELPAVEAGKMEINIYNASGVLVSQKTENVVSGPYSQTLSMFDLPSGFYIVKVWNGETSHIGKVLKE